MIPSPKGVPFEEVPELSLAEVVDEVNRKLGGPDFVVVNFANGDVIGHTSCNSAKIAAASHMSRQLERLVSAAKAQDYVVMITADHGNLESMITPTGKPDVAHTTNPVPFLVIDPRRNDPISPRNGSLCDVAPTVLHAMGIPLPPEMNASTLIPGVRFDGGRKVLLIILDGWGLGEKGEGNPIFLADTPYWDFLLETYPCARLHASGSFVGLGQDKAGNSEAGHLNLGAGRIVPQAVSYTHLEVHGAADAVLLGQGNFRYLAVQILLDLFDHTLLQLLAALVDHLDAVVIIRIMAC